jgi:O-antigen ligase
LSRLLTFLGYLVLLVVSLGVAAFGVMNYVALTRGVESSFPATARILGTNVALEQYASDEELQRALDTLKRAGITHVRQYFPWREIEPQREIYDWAKWDRIANAARANGIQLVAVLHTAPVWSQREHERDMPNAPPADFSEYTRFAGEFSRRYGDTIDYYQIWDEPNVEPNWGKRNADAVEYAQLLIPASQAIRTNDPNAKIVLAGLAMNLELHRPHPNYSEILFLRGLYEVGAQKYFDIVAAKPYGMWTGPEDRTVNSSVLNFSRLILLRDEMRQYGDAAKPVWAVEMGWNALPADWKGSPSPWGTDTEEKQADRLQRALERAGNEWNWLTGEFPLYLQPNVAPENPRWGFALMSPAFQPRSFYDALTRFLSSPPEHIPPPSAPIFPLALLLGVALVSVWRAWHWSLTLPLARRWRDLKTRVNMLPEPVQFLVILAAAAAFYVSPNTILNFVLFAALIFLFALRLDFGIALTIFSIPFWNYPKTLFGGFQLSPVEALTWIATAAFLVDFLLNRIVTARNRALDESRITREDSVAWFRTTLQPLTSLDWAVLAFLVLGFVSTQWAGNFGVASREFRIAILDPILVYALIRLSPFSLRQTRWFVYALLASGIAVCAVGLYRYLTDDVILADGIARLIAVWGSPNNVGLYLGRLLPIALAFVFMLPVRKDGPLVRSFRMPFGFSIDVNARWMYAGLVALFAVTILLTYSRGALFLGVPASVLFVMIVLFTQSHKLSRRAWVAIGTTVIVAGVAILPFLTSERFLSLFQTGTGTGFFRIALWTSAVNMIRDHPLLGVGLDNFLYEYSKYILPEAWREPNLSHPHNFILDFWVRLGIGGVAVFAWMLITFYKRAWNSFTNARDGYTRALMLGLMASVVNMLAHGLIDASYFVVDLAYVFLLTLALAANPFRVTDENPPLLAKERAGVRSLSEHVRATDSSQTSTH